MLLRNAERGRLPDFAIRVGIRRLLKKRLHDLRTHPSELDEFLESTFDQPIAVMCKSANEQHYEVPAQFFQQVLGPHLKYSCYYWRDGVSDLETAEREALEITCRNAQLSDGMKILELGCGWGSLSLYMAERYPNSQITSVSNSSSQRAYIQQKAAERGLANLTVLTADMNDFSTSETFDRVVSVEMFEHMRNHRELTNRIRGWLRPQGQLFVHIFCHRESAYLFETDTPQSVIESTLLDFQIYPNPAQDYLSFAQDLKGAKITVTNTMGQVVLTQNLTENTIDTRVFQAGLYLMRVEGYKTQTFIVQ